jgi:hypothetical protein
MKRYFIPRSKTIGNTGLPTMVHHWEYGRKLKCFFKDGISWKSEYTLRELLKIEKPIEVKMDGGVK